MSEQQIKAAAAELHEYVRQLFLPWQIELRGHEGDFERILRKHAEGQQAASRWCIHSSPTLCKFPDCECEQRS